MPVEEVDGAFEGGRTAGGSQMSRLRRTGMVERVRASGVPRWDITDMVHLFGVSCGEYWLVLDDHHLLVGER